MERVLKALSIIGIYINRHDPRVFIYRNSKWTWCGVTLNCAHWQSWLWLLAFVGFWFPLRFGVQALFGYLMFPYGREFAMCVYVSVVVWHGFHMAKHDLLRNPGPRAERPFHN